MIFLRKKIFENRNRIINIIGVDFKQISNFHSSTIKLNSKPFFSQNPLDRLHELRALKPTSCIDHCLNSMDPKFVLFAGILPLMNFKQKKTLDKKEPFGNVITNPVILNSKQLLNRIGSQSISEQSLEDLFLLGQHKKNKSAYFALNVTNNPKFEINFENEKAYDLRRIAPYINCSESAAILSHAKSIIGWHLNHKFCSCCGAMSFSYEGGQRRKCKECDASHFPRTDPVAISLVVDRQTQSVLLGRQSFWPAGRYSCVAGFVDVSETLEQAVAREIFEETGVVVNNVDYISSQNWPNYSQLMLATISYVDGQQQVKLNDKELEDARWFTLQQLIDTTNGKLVPIDKTTRFMIPDKYAVARTLIDFHISKNQK